jgi:hypothetical protein
MCPDINDLIVSLVVGDETHVVVAFSLLLLAHLHQQSFSLFFRNNNTSPRLNDNPPRNAILKPNVFHIIQELAVLATPEVLRITPIISRSDFLVNNSLI